MLPHAGTDSRTWREVTALGADLGRLAQVAGAPGRAEVALLHDWESPHERVRLGGYPAPWRELLGLRVEEFAPLPDGAAVRLDDVPAAGGPATGVPTAGTGVTAIGAGGAGRVWQDVIGLRGADPLLRYAEGHLAGQPAVTRHSYGRGETVYLGTLPDRATLRDLVAQACGRAGIEFRTDVPPGVEVVRRGDYLFVISHLDTLVELDLGGKSRDLLTSRIVGPAAVSGRAASWYSRRGSEPI
jgi:beta-galactosidase